MNNFPKREVILISGMHRSGTSAVAGLVYFLGVNVSSEMMPATHDNPHGYWESGEVVGFHEGFLRLNGLSWSSVEPINLTLQVRKEAKIWIQGYVKEEFEDSSSFLIKDPRICRFLPLWTDALAEQADVKIILPFRLYSEVATSLIKREVENHFHNGEGFNLQHAYLLWLRYVIESERDSRGFDRSFVNYQNLIEDWRLVKTKFESELELTFPGLSEADEAKIDSFLTPKLNRSRSFSEQTKDSIEFKWVIEIYSALLLLEEDPYDQKAMAIFDTVALELKIADDLYAPILKKANHKIANDHVANVRLQEKLLKDTIELEKNLEHMEFIKTQMIREQENELTLLKRYIQKLEEKLA